MLMSKEEEKTMTGMMVAFIVILFSAAVFTQQFAEKTRPPEEGTAMVLASVLLSLLSTIFYEYLAGVLFS